MDQPHGTWRLPFQEARLTWRFVYRDLPTTVAAAAAFVPAGARHHALSPEAAALAFLKAVVFMGVYIYVFAVANQLSGVQEDSVNKPDRPLVAGLVTRAGARRRWVAGMVLFTLLGWALDVLPWTLMWQAVVVLHNFAGWGRWGPTKNLAMVLGAIAELAAIWQLTGPLDATGWRWILTAAIVFGAIGSHVQDLRDMRGDLAVGRRTLPLMIGERAARWQIGLSMTAVPLAVYALLYAPERFGVAVVAWSLVLAVLCWTVTVRVLRRRSPVADDRTWLLYQGVYCATLLSGASVL